MGSWSWILLVLTALLIKFASTQPLWIEENYSNGLYPIISGFQRWLFGWIPLSLGDIFYAFLIMVIIYRTVRLVKVIIQRKMNRQYLLSGLKQVIFFFLFVYVFFYSLWGLNYDRTGISYQLNINLKKYTQPDVETLTKELLQRINQYADLLDLDKREDFKKKRNLFEGADQAYEYAEKQYPYLKYKPRSVKPSIYSYLGNYLGFQGYYNPFSGEGQVNTTIPAFLEPFVSTHEVAHQLGYAKESEANFVGFLACKAYPNNTYRYSMYFDMFRYAIGELHRFNPEAAALYLDQLHPQVKKDIEELEDFFDRYQNPIEPVISWIYDGYLQANAQPEGKRAYNQVVGFLIAYYKKYGVEAL